MSAAEVGVVRASAGELDRRGVNVSRALDVGRRHLLPDSEFGELHAFRGEERLALIQGEGVLGRVDARVLPVRLAALATEAPLTRAVAAMTPATILMAKLRCLIEIRSAAIRVECGPPRIEFN